MLNHPTLEKLHELRLTGMAKALGEQMGTADIGSLSFEERLGLMVDREMTERENRRLGIRLKNARLRERACLEDIDYRHHRGLDKSLMTKLATCHWIGEHLNILIEGPTGAGKTWIACALAHKALLDGHTAAYFRLPRLLDELSVARADGRYGRIMKALARADVIILDDLGLAPLTTEGRRELLEIMEDRHGLRSTIVTSQLPVSKWHETMGDPTIADAILDRLVHNAYKVSMKGESMRKTRSKLTKT